MRAPASDSATDNCAGLAFSTHIGLQSRLKYGHNHSPFFGSLTDSSGESSQKVATWIPYGLGAHEGGTTSGSIEPQVCIRRRRSLAAKEGVSAAVSCPIPFINTNEKEGGLGLVIEERLAGPFYGRWHFYRSTKFILRVMRIPFVLMPLSTSKSQIRDMEFHCENCFVLDRSGSTLNLVDQGRTIKTLKNTRNVRYLSKKSLRRYAE
jgi:hypothetical protein